jgi:hypothetical protein
MRSPLCHDWPETQWRLTLDIGKYGPVIWGKEGGSNKRNQTMLFTADHSDDLPHFISIVMPSWQGSMRSPPCHYQPEIQWRLALDIGEDGPVIWGQEGGGNRRIQTMFIHCRS